jgi:hypothetical protein
MTNLQMPTKKYDEERSVEFQLLANHAGVRHLDLRVALSNVFVFMARQGRPRRG